MLRGPDERQRQMPLFPVDRYSDILWAEGPPSFPWDLPAFAMGAVSLPD